MFSKSYIGLLALTILATTLEPALGRERIFERDGRAIFPRRFGNEANVAVIQRLSGLCAGQICGNLAGKAITPLLAAQPECSQQDMADEIIDAAKQLQGEDPAAAAAMIQAAIEYRQIEKNTPPDFTTNPPTARNSVFCQKAPRNAELNGLVQAQDPANDPNIFFDPALGRSVIKGSQANTQPFNGAGAATPPPVVSPPAANPPAANPPAANNPPANPPAAAPAGADFGICTVPEIEFGQGFDNRRETSFRPADLTNFNHGSAQNVNIITQFVCDTLVNRCGANQAARDICAQARTAASAAPTGSGAQADAFNAVFGITTTFVDDPVINNQGIVVSPGNGNGAAPGNNAGNNGNGNGNANTGGNGNGNGGASSGIGNFGSCSVPEIEFGAGFQGRRETSFQPVDRASFSQGSAQNINIITRAVCDTLTNTCGANQAAKDTCARAAAAAAAAPRNTGAQADAFNAVFGINTNFASVQQIDDQGRPVGTPAAGGNNGGNQNDGGDNNDNNGGGNNNNNNNGGNNAGAGGNLQTFSGALGGVTAPTVTANGNQFSVTGNASFNSLRSAVVRSCDVQNNQCANAANASGNQNGFNVPACNAQQAQCIANAPAN